MSTAVPIIRCPGTASGRGHDFVNATLRGNHEEMLLRFLDDPAVGPVWRQLGGMETLSRMASMSAEYSPPTASRGFHDACKKGFLCATFPCWHN